MANDSAQASAAADLVETLYTVMPIVVGHVSDRLEDFGMTHTDYWALRSVDGPMPMKDLAQCMDIDPSYVTLLADRLEELGLIERQPHPTDRRVKNLVLTAKGKRFKKTIPEKIWDGPNTFSALSDAERNHLKVLLAKVVASHGDGDVAALPESA
ncbi:MAG: MarR family transcriptional regulator [Acidimicrobiia bacterium]|nr:MarR family transcriptional regulator [Acidimicrobiia bacterium]